MLWVFSLLLLFVAIGVLGLASWLFFHALSMLRGAPYVVSHDENIAFAVAAFQTKRRLADIGSGDGTVLLGLARSLPETELHGYELNPLLVLLSRWRIRRAGYSDRITIHWANLWRIDYRTFDGVYLYGLLPIMPALETKLDRELKPGVKIVSAGFPFPHWRPLQTTPHAFLYEIGHQ